MTTSTRIGTSANLQTGGTYDLLLVKFLGTFPEGQITFGFHNTPMKVTGLQKVAQTFLKLLLTTKGSDPFIPDRGTFFPEMTLGSNQTTDDPRYVSAIKEAVEDAADQTRTCLNAQNVDLSSCLSSVEILGLDKIDDSLTLYVAIRSLKGEQAQIAVPFPEFGLTT